MIKIFSNISNNFFNKLTDDHYSRKIYSNFLAYGNKFDFCKFFSVFNNKTQAVICLFNSTMTVATIYDFVLNEDFLCDIETFIKINSPETVELNINIANLIANRISFNYKQQIRTDFMFSNCKTSKELKVNEHPKLDDVYNILKECFPQLKNTYEMWITDTSHRIRHGISKVFLAEDCTTATIQYIINSNALIGQVGTIPEKRGKNYARELLYYIGKKLFEQNIKAHIFARNHRASFYEEIGFIPNQKDIVFERKKENE